MILVDLNLLIYSVNADSPHHEKSRAWWEKKLGQSSPVYLAWITIIGFIRLTTQPRILPSPLSAVQSQEIVDLWLRHPSNRLSEPRERHWPILKNLLTISGTSGRGVTDAHLAALAVEHDLELCSSDQDFARYPGLRWTNPL